MKLAWTEGVEVLASRSGVPTLRWAGRFLYSQYDPLREATRTASAVPAGPLLLVGLGLGYLAEACAGRPGFSAVGLPGETERLRAHRPEAAVPPVEEREEEVIPRLAAARVLAGWRVLIDPSWESMPVALAAVRTAVEHASGLVLALARSGRPDLPSALDHAAALHGFGCEIVFGGGSKTDESAPPADPLAFVLQEHAPRIADLEHVTADELAVLYLWESIHRRERGETGYRDRA